MQRSDAPMTFVGCFDFRSSQVTAIHFAAEAVVGSSEGLLTRQSPDRRSEFVTCDDKPDGLARRHLRLHADAGAPAEFHSNRCGTQKVMVRLRPRLLDRHLFGVRR